MFDVIEGATRSEEVLCAYAFSTENWNRSPDEVRWLMGFNGMSGGGGPAG